MVHIENENRYFRANLFGKLTTNLSSRDEFSVTGTFQSSKWNASGEIPLRAVEAGTTRSIRRHRSVGGRQHAPQHCPVELSL